MNLKELCDELEDRRDAMNPGHGTGTCPCASCQFRYAAYRIVPAILAAARLAPTSFAYVDRHGIGVSAAAAVEAPAFSERVRALWSALQRLADASEAFAGSDPDMASHRDTEIGFDEALEHARSVLVSSPLKEGR